MTSMMVPNMFFSHLEQLLSSIHCSKRLYLEIAVKFSSQEHGRPPRIQEEKVALTPKSQNLGYTLLEKSFQTCIGPLGSPENDLKLGHFTPFQSQKRLYNCKCLSVCQFVCSSVLKQNLQTA